MIVIIDNSVHEIVSMLCGSVIIIPLEFLGGVFLCMRKDVRLSLVILVAVPLLIGAGLLGCEVLKTGKRAEGKKAKARTE